MNDKKHGGARKGAGRKKKESRETVTFRLDKEVADYLNYFSKGTGHPKNSLVNDILFSAFSSPNEDFFFCPKCKAPVLYLPVLNLSAKIDCECSYCNHKFEYEL